MAEATVTTTVPGLLAFHGRRQPAAPALGDVDGRTVSYAWLLREVERTGATLAALGIGPGSRVATALPDGFAAALVELAVMSAAVCVPIEPSLPARESAALLVALKVDALIVEGGDEPAAAAARALELVVLHLVPGAAFGGIGLEFCGGRQPLPVGNAKPAAGDVALVLRSSGSTGPPKVVPLTQAQLVARAGANPIAGDDRGLCVVPMFTASAIESNLVATLVAGATVTFLPTFEAAPIAVALTRLQPTYLWAVPTVLSALLESLSVGALTLPASLRLLRTGGAPLAPSLQLALEAASGRPVMQGYGMTETGGIARNPLPPAPRPPGSVGRPLWPGVAILGRGGAIGRWQDDGEVVVRGPGVMTGYEDAPDANREAFHDGWFRTGDIGRFDADGYLHLTGRRHELINRGGFKVAPAEVDAAMLRHPEVADAAAFAVEHASLGEDVAVAVVLRPGATANPSQLRTHALAHLPPSKVPNAVVIVDALPRNPAGKVNRTTLARALRDAVRPAYREPADDGEVRVAAVFAAALKLPGVGADDNFFELGGDSLTAMQAIARINADCGLELPVRSLFEAPTVALYAAVVREALAGRGTRPAIARRAGASPGGGAR